MTPLLWIVAGVAAFVVIGGALGPIDDDGFNGLHKSGVHERMVFFLGIHGGLLKVLVKGEKFGILASVLAIRDLFTVVVLFGSSD